MPECTKLLPCDWLISYWCRQAKLIYIYILIKWPVSVCCVLVPQVFLLVCLCVWIDASYSPGLMKPSAENQLPCLHEKSICLTFFLHGSAFICFTSPNSLNGIHLAQHMHARKRVCTCANTICKLNQSRSRRYSGNRGKQGGAKNPSLVYEVVPVLTPEVLNRQRPCDLLSSGHRDGHAVLSVAVHCFCTTTYFFL